MAFLSTSTVTKNPEVQVSAVAASPENLDELVAARVALEPAFAKAFADTTFTPEQITEVTHLSAKYRPVFLLSPDELGCCNIAEATFPLPPGTRPVDRAPYRTSPHVQEKIDEQITKLLKQGISPVNTVTKADGSPRFCIDYRNTLNGHII